MGNDISRREFLKISGAGAIGVAAAACASGRGGQQEPVSGQPQQQGTMEMRTNPGNGQGLPSGLRLYEMAYGQG